jgi:predicted nuclease of restriction endonuclease-like RecB superfamily
MVKKEDLKEFCKLANLKCSGNKDEIIERVKEYLDNYKYAPRYLRGLSKEEVFEKKFDIKYNQLLEKYTGIKSYEPLKTDDYKQNKKSKYTEKWNKKYEEAKTLTQKSKISNVPLDILQEVEKRGLAAWRGGQHRPGASQKSWAIARVNSFLTCGKTFYYPDHLLVKESIKISPKSKMFWEKQGCKFSKLGKKTPSK